MNEGLAKLLTRSDGQENPTFSSRDLACWNIGELTPFIIKAATPSIVECSGCEQSCYKEVIKHQQKVYIRCDEPPDMGLIEIEPEQMIEWNVNLPRIANLIAQSMGLPAPQEIQVGRLHDLGTLNSRGIFLMRGINWPDAHEVLKNPRILNANPFLITLQDANADGVQHQPLDAILYQEDKEWQINKERLMMALGHKLDTQGNSFRQLGKQWQIFYEGKEIDMPDSKGMTYIQYLLLRPDKEVTAIELQALINKPLDADFTVLLEKLSVQGVSDCMMDDKTKKDLTARLLSLRNTNPDSKEILEIEKYLNQAQYAGKSKPFSGVNTKSRQSVQKAISTAIKNIEKIFPELSTHFKNSITTGTFCVYKPEKGVSWQ